MVNKNLEGQKVNNPHLDIVLLVTEIYIQIRYFLFF